MVLLLYLNVVHFRYANILHCFLTHLVKFIKFYFFQSSRRADSSVPEQRGR